MLSKKIAQDATICLSAKDIFTSVLMGAGDEKELLLVLNVVCCSVSSSSSTHSSLSRVSSRNLLDGCSVPRQQCKRKKERKKKTEKRRTTYIFSKNLITQQFFEIPSAIFIRLKIYFFSQQKKRETIKSWRE